MSFLIIAFELLVAIKTYTIFPLKNKTVANNKQSREIKCSRRENLLFINAEQMGDNE